MENASKALIMAGGVLTALLVISLLVYARQSLKEYGEAKEQTETLSQTSEFNQSFDAYNREGVYGSELLSLANLVDSYNKENEKTADYTPLSMSVTFKNDIAADNKKLFEKNKTYTHTQIINIAVNTSNKNSIQSILNDYSKNTGTGAISGVSIATLSGYRTSDLEAFLKEKGKTSQLDVTKQHINKYLSYRTALTYLKQRKFNAGTFSYMPSTSRVTKMTFIEKTN